MNFIKLPISFFIALRYWNAKSADRFGRLVTQLASIGIALGVMALIIVLSVMNGLEKKQKELVLASLPQAIIQPITGHFPLADGIPKEFKSLDSITKKIVPINVTNVILQTKNGIDAAQVIGVNNFNEDPALAMFEGQSLNEYLPQGKFNLLISNQLAQRLDLKVGDKVRLMLSEKSRYTPFGQMPIQRLFTISGLYFSDVPSTTNNIFTNIADIGRLMHIKPTQVQGYRLFLNDPFDITLLPEKLNTKKWLIHDWREQKGEFFQAVKMEKNMMGLLISLIVIVAISNILTSLSLMVVDKQGEIAILQTQGLGRHKIRNIFILQGLIVGIVGTFFGTLCGILITMHLDTILAFMMPGKIMLPVAISLTQVIGIVVLSLMFSLLSTLYPAYRAAQIAPAHALRYE